MSKTSRFVLLSFWGASLVGIYFGTKHLVSEYDPRLKFVGNDIFYAGEPFTGFIYGLYPNRRPQRLTPVWLGKREGTERIWYASGVTMVERPYAHGLPDGDWKQWYEDGDVKSFKPYRKGLVSGEVWGWHANGQVSDFDLYENGREISHKSWIADGTPYYNYVYQDGRKVGMRGGEYCKRLSRIKLKK